MSLGIASKDFQEMFSDLFSFSMSSIQTSVPNIFIINLTYTPVFTYITTQGKINALNDLGVQSQILPNKCHCITHFIITYIRFVLSLTLRAVLCCAVSVARGRPNGLRKKNIIAQLFRTGMERFLNSSSSFRLARISWPAASKSKTTKHSRAIIVHYLPTSSVQVAGFILL